jgi:MFS family permease
MTSAADDRSLIAHTGFSYFPIAFLARLPFAMMVVGVLTFVVDARGSVALGGLTSAAVGVGTVLTGPLIGGAVDRFGQRRVLVPVGLGNAALLGAFPLVAASPASDAVLLGTALLIGATAPQAAAMSRSRLLAIIRGRMSPTRALRTFGRTMSYESAADETAFVIGPVVVGILASFLAPWAPLAGAAALSFVFVTAFALHPTARVDSASAVPAAAVAPVRALLRPRVLVLVAATFAVGMFFGATLTSLTAFMAEQGRADAAALLYGLMGIGSAVLALAVAVMPARFGLRHRWLVFAGILSASAVGFALSGSVAAVAVWLCLLGLGVGPTLVTLFSLAGLRSPAGRSATTMTILGSAVALAQSLASAATGAVAEAHGADVARILPLVAAALCLALGVANVALERREEAAAAAARAGRRAAGSRA